MTHAAYDPMYWVYLSAWALVAPRRRVLLLLGGGGAVGGRD